MTSHSARTMREVTETVAIHAFLYFWNKFLAQIPGKGHFKSGKSSVLQARNRSFVRRGFRRKVPICLSSTKLSEVVQTLPLTLLHQTAAYKCFQIFLKSCLKSCECIHIYIYIYIYVCVCVCTCVHDAIPIGRPKYFTIHAILTYVKLGWSPPRGPAPSLLPPRAHARR